MVAVVAALMVCTSCFTRNEQKEREADLMYEGHRIIIFVYVCIMEVWLALPTLVICAQTFYTAAKDVVRHCQSKRASSSNLRRGRNPRDVWLQPGGVAELWHPGVPELGSSGSCWVKSGCHLSSAFLILHPPCPGRKPNPCSPALARQRVQKSTHSSTKSVLGVFFF